MSNPHHATPIQVYMKRREHGRTEGKVLLLTPHISSQAMTGSQAFSHLCFAFALRNCWMTTNRVKQKCVCTHRHTEWPEAYLLNHYVNFKERFRDKSATSLLAHAGRIETGWEKARRRMYGHLREQRGMTERGSEGGDSTLWSPVVTALQEWESKARTALLNELMTRTFDVH